MADRLAVALAPFDFVGRGQFVLTDFRAGRDSCPENLSARRPSGTLIGARGFSEHDVRGVPSTPRPADGTPGKERFGTSACSVATEHRHVASPCTLPHTRTACRLCRVVVRLTARTGRPPSSGNCSGGCDHAQIKCVWMHRWGRTDAASKPTTYPVDRCDRRTQLRFPFCRIRYRSAFGRSV